MDASFSPEKIAGLVEAAAEVAEHVDLTALLESTVRLAMDLTGAEYGALGVLGTHGGLSDFIHVGIDGETAQRIGQLPKGAGLLGTITTVGHAVRTDDISTHSDSVGFPLHHPEMHTFLGVPVRVGDRVFGNLYLTEKAGGFTAEDEQIIEFLAITAGSAISTLRLQERLRRVALIEDRERIARDLHDSIIQELFALGLALQAAVPLVTSDPDEVQARIESATDKLDETIAALRRYIFDLRPPMWATADLRRTLADVVGRLSAPHAADVRLDVTGDTRRLGQAVFDAVVALVTEGLSNAVRHAEPEVVQITVRAGDTQVLVRIEDDGAGFDGASPSSGMGLVNMRSRVEELDGSFAVTSAPESGTIVQAAIPIN